MLDPVELFPEIPNLYQFPSVHAGMLYDEERVAKYSAAINQVIKKGDVVADIGTGTGILAFLCLKAGAKRVHAIERSPVIKWAKLIADKNGFSDKIVFHNKDSRNCNLPEKVDAVVSELIGHIAFEEGMAESLFDAKKRFLVAGGVMIPEKVNLRIALVEENEVYPECIDCWQDIEGIDYSLMRAEAIKALYLTSLSSHDLLSEPKTFFRINFKEQRRIYLQEKNVFDVCRPGKVNGIALWFEATLSSNINLSSGPWTRTHWQQCFAPIARAIAVNTGDLISVSLEMNLRTKKHNSFKFKFGVEKENC